MNTTLKLFALSLMLFFTFQTIAQETNNPKVIIKSSSEIKSVKMIDSPEDIQKTEPQKQSVSNSSQEYPKTYSTNRSGVQREHNKEYFEERLESLEYLVEAIDQKVEYVKSDQSMREKAEADGWFTKMETSKQNALSEIKEVQQKISSFE